MPKDEGERQIATVPSNILDRQFEAERPNQKWIADFTYIWTAEGWLYVSAGSGRGPWHIARSKALSVGLSNAHFKSLGLPSLIEAR